MIKTLFTILVDSMEQHPFGFDNIKADVSKLSAMERRAIDDGVIEPVYEVQTKHRGLGVGMGDYSISGHVGECSIERKSLEDCQSTVLGWGKRRERFQNELANLAEMKCSAVVVECSFGQLLADAPSHGRKSAEENRKILFRQILSWQQEYRVPWLFCDSRRMAELATFRLLQKFWISQQQKLKASA